MGLVSFNHWIIIFISICKRNRQRLSCICPISELNFLLCILSAYTTISYILICCIIFRGCSPGYHQFWKSRIRIVLARKVQIRALADDHLGGREYLQSSDDVATDDASLAVAQGYMKVSVGPGQGPDQGNDLERAAKLLNLLRMEIEKK